MGVIKRLVLACAVFLLGLAGCSPTFNWREVRVGNAAVLALMPCKPEQAERQVPLQGHMTTLHMASCDVANTTFAVATLRVPDGVASADAAQAWKAATLSSLNAPGSQARDWPLPVRSGWPETGWQADGVRHNGQPVRARVVTVGRGHSLHQWAVYGEPPPEALSAWLDGMRFASIP